MIAYYEGSAISHLNAGVFTVFPAVKTCEVQVSTNSNTEPEQRAT
jgi:hypothetical protein